MRSVLCLLFLFTLCYTSKAQVYYHYAWNEKELSELLPVKDTVTVLKYGRQIPSTHPRFRVDNEEVDFPDTILYFNNLRSLDVGLHTDCRNFSPEMNKLNRLEKMELCVHTIGPEIGYLKEMRKMVLYNVRSEIPKEFGSLKKLEYLYLDNDSITEFPKALFELENIKALQFSMDKIDSIPEGLSKLERLEEILFYCGRLKNLPQDIWKVKSLKKIILDVGSRTFDFTTAFELISKSSSIESIGFRYTILENIPSLSILQNIKILKVETLLDRLEELNKKLAEVAKIKNLEVLTIKLPYTFQNEIKTIPDSIRLFKNLKILTIQGQAIDSIPLWIAEMDNLELINIEEKNYWNNKKNQKLITQCGRVSIKYGSYADPKIYTRTRHPIKEMKINDTLQMTYMYRSKYSHGPSYHYDLFLVKDKEYGFELLLKLIENNDYKQTGWAHYRLSKDEVRFFKKIDKSSNLYKERKHLPRRKLRYQTILSFKSNDRIKTINDKKKAKVFLEIYKKYKKKSYSRD